jgi:acid phosphatase family membrane protein YuiD
MNSSILEFLEGVPFWTLFFSWMVAQSVKMLVGLTHKGRLDFRYLVSTGGMPSAHSAMVSGLAASIGLTAGFGTPVFAVAIGFALIVMFDASTVRRAAGQQAKLLNEIIDEIFREHHFSEKKMAELLGHTRLEVFMGMVIGVLVALLVDSVALRIQSAG